MVDDAVGVKEGVKAGLENTPVAAKRPCSECGAETKEHEVDEETKQVISRICSKPACRNVSAV